VLHRSYFHHSSWIWIWPARKSSKVNIAME
jgi:hypothetical protein